MLLFFSAKDGAKELKNVQKSQNSGLVQSRKCKARKTLKNDALDAKIGVDSAANEPRKGSENLTSTPASRTKTRTSTHTSLLI